MQTTSARMERLARAARLEKLREEAVLIVSTGRCPDCGSALRRNLALDGWWQCEQYGSLGFRARDDDPQCSFQCFTA